MSNNKKSMKLYTEEQVNELRRALRDIAQWDEFLEDDWEDAGNRAMDALRCFEKLTPIELPSDEEIEKGVKNEYPLTGHVGIDHRNYLRKVGYIQGAKMVINKIQGGNNEQQ